MRHASIAIVLLLTHSQVLAHGAPPAVTGIASADAIGPLVVRLNEGLAVREGDHYTYLCPALWGDHATAEVRAPQALGDGAITYVVGAGEVGSYTLRDGEITPLEGSPLDGSSVVSLVESDGAVYALSLGARGSEVIALHRRATTVWSAPDIWPAIAARDGQVLLARTLDEGVEVQVLSEDGDVLDRGQAALAGTLTGLRLRAPGAASDPIYMTLFDGTDHVLGELSLDDWTWRQRSRAELPIGGPVRVAGAGQLITHGEQLMRLQPGGAVEIPGASGVTCLQRWRELPYACTGSAVRALDAGGLGDVLYELRGLHEPDPARTPADADPACGFQWLLFGNDLERSGLAPVAHRGASTPDAIDGATQDSATDDGTTHEDGGTGASGAAAADRAASSNCGTAGEAPGSHRGHGVALSALALALAWLAQRVRRPSP